MFFPHYYLFIFLQIRFFQFKGSETNLQPLLLFWQRNLLIRIQYCNDPVVHILIFFHMFQLHYYVILNCLMCDKKFLNVLDDIDIIYRIYFII